MQMAACEAPDVVNDMVARGQHPETMFNLIINKVMSIILYHLYCKDVHLSPWIKCISNIFQTNGINYIWLMQDHCIDAKSIKKCECDQFLATIYGTVELQMIIV